MFPNLKRMLLALYMMFFLIRELHIQFYLHLKNMRAHQQE